MNGQKIRQKTWAMLMTASMATAALTGCSGNSGESASPAGSTSPTAAAAAKAPLEVSYIWQDQVIPNETHTLKDKELEKRFNVKLAPEYVNWDGSNDKLNVMFASGEYADFFMNINAGLQLNKWGQNGYLLPINDYLDKLPNYRKLFSEEEWNFLTKYVSTGSGKIYFLPGQNPSKMQRVWIYRKDIFDKEGLKLPGTMDELYQVLKTLKAKYPDSVPMSSRWGADGLLAGFTKGFRTDVDFWKNPDTNKVEYAPSTGNYRDMLVYLSKLYKENLIEKEFATITGPQWEEKNYTGKSLIEYSYATRSVDFENKAKAAPGTDWELLPQLIRGYSDKPALAPRELPFYMSGGIAISSAVKGEKLDKILEMIDWLCTPEGSRLMQLGQEGQHYDTVGSKVKPKEQYKDFLTLFKETGFHFFLGRETQLAEPSVNDKVMELFGKEAYAPFVAFSFSDEDEKSKSSLVTGLNDKRLEFTQKAIMGTVDPSSDEAWNKYVQDLEKAGLSKLTEIYTRSAK
ncbi:MAG: transporter substrate-binding protein [Paenibacillaceae bacterium]|jgi:putative aldouronate transport system substrate-binding protein|nr:transporter substrate-binding protein [Paenibacillaceae bacterium]